MTNEELQQITAIIQAAVNPITTRLDSLEQGQKNLEQGQKNLEAKITQVETRLETKITTLETKVSAVETKIEKSEQKILTKLDQLEKLTADYLDSQVQTTKRRLDRVEKHLNLT